MEEVYDGVNSIPRSIYGFKKEQAGSTYTKWIGEQEAKYVTNSVCDQGQVLIFLRESKRPFPNFQKNIICNAIKENCNLFKSLVRQLGHFILWQVWLIFYLQLYIPQWLIEKPEERWHKNPLMNCYLSNGMFKINKYAIKFFD